MREKCKQRMGKEGRGQEAGQGTAIPNWGSEDFKEEALIEMRNPGLSDTGWRIEVRLNSGNLNR